MKPYPIDHFDTRLLPPPGRKLAQKLGHHVPLNAAERGALDALLARNVRNLGHRAVLVDSESVPNEIHVLIDGWACRFAKLSSGKRQIVAFYLPGDVCDFDVFLMTQMDQSIAAIGNVRIAGINRQMLNELSRNQPRLSQGLWWESMVTAGIQRAWTINVGLRPARQRLAHLLCELHTRLSLVKLVEDNECDLPLTQNDLGDACAMTAIHTNRALQDLRRDGLLDLEAGRLRIHDRDALAAVAGFDPSYLQVSMLCASPTISGIPIAAE